MTAAARAKREAPQDDGRARMLKAALALFVEKGFHGASMRDIAMRAETSVSFAYYYFDSKQAILFQLVHDVTTELVGLLEAADRAFEDPVERLAAVVRAHVLFHAERQDESFIGNSELRSLRPHELAEIVALRDRVADAFRRPVTDGAASGRFDCADPSLTSRAIVTMATAVAVWRRADGPMTPDDIAKAYVSLALRMVGAPDRR